MILMQEKSALRWEIHGELRFFVPNTAHVEFGFKGLEVGTALQLQFVATTPWH
ncbi:hypothetical protein EVA_13791 [gut metagenome]|uniref:Uncharacterized protein n=1 Tax=gut metagenome TaxID=749906 RepID=J9FUC2_9ZZZZ